MKFSESRGKVRQLKASDNACFIYTDKEEWRKFIVSFILNGLQNNEKCCYIFHSSKVDDITALLIEAGVDVVEYRKSGQMFFVPFTKTYYNNGFFTPDMAEEFLSVEIKKAINEGYSSLRVAWEMDWILKENNWQSKLLANESIISKIVSEKRCLVLNQYNRKRFNWPDIKNIASFYPVIVYNSDVYENYDYLSPQELMISNPEKVEEERWLQYLARDNYEETRTKFYMKIMENAGLPFTLCLPDGYIELWNRAFKELTGYNDSDLSKMTWTQDLTPPEWREYEARMLNMLHETRKAVRYEKEFLCKDGSRMPVELLVQHILNKDSEIGGYLAFINNITELKKVQEELEASEKKYTALVAKINDGIVILQEGIIRFANEVMLRIAEVEHKEVINKPFIEFVAAGYKQQVMSMYKRRLSGDSVPERYEIVLLSKAGKNIPVEITATVIIHDGTLADMVVLHDLSETKNAERMFNALSSGTPMGLFILQDGKFKFVSPQFEKLTGYTIEESTKLSPQKLVHPDDREMVRKNAIDMLRGLRTAPYEYRIIRKNGQLTWVVESATSINYRGKKAIMVAGIDITEQKRSEAIRKEAEQRAQIASRLATVGEMAAGIAHEINNPLTTVIGYTELLMQGDIPDSLRKDLRYINNGAQRVADIVKRMLTFARQTKPQRRNININDIIQNTIDMQLYALNNANIQVETKFDTDLPLTLADSGQLQQVFLNLIINAMTAMKVAHGGGKLQIQTQYIDNIIRITFKDSGPGISKENIDKIFNPFFTTSEVGQGTGLGLSVCHGIVTGHNGKIYVKSRLGRGATFIIDLPVGLESAQLEFGDTEIQEPENKLKARILVVDDELLIRRLLSRILTKEGHNVDCVDNAIDALEKIKTERYNLILLDIMMPGMSGIKLYENVKSIAMSLAQRVVFITGDVMGAETQKFLTKTKAKYFTKPFETAKLKKEINNILSRSQA